MEKSGRGMILFHSRGTFSYHRLTITNSIINKWSHRVSEWHVLNMLPPLA